MAIPDVADEFFTLESRIASFQTAQQISKRRASNASSKAPKSLKWPHKFLSAEELAKAGFFYYPTQGNPDNVACFLCHKALDGWEEDDDPLAEHLKHSSDCGWAIVATIEKQDGDFSQENPTSVRMIEARKATFSDKWPHETKKGWKCKIKQMVDSGWKYTPTMECDDMATCAYCSLALDGWEPSDKPMEEHFKRSPECPFFTLVNNHKSPAVKRTKSKKDRTSKASRLSTQSAFTVTSEAPSVADGPAGDEDSILTTATNATTKKMGKTKKAPAGKGRKTRAKKGEPVEVAAPEPEDADFEVKVDSEPKPTQGKKRKSEDQESTVPVVEMAPPPPKRRATRTRGSIAVDESNIESSDNMQPETSKPAGRKGRASVRSTRKASVASVVSLRAPVIDDEEIDKALEADLERRLSDDEMETISSITTKKSSRSSKIVKADHAMFGVDSNGVDDAVIEAELEAMDIESKPLPKAKGAKGKQPRKPSAKQQAAAKKAAEAEAEAQARQLAEEDEASQQIVMELEHSISMQQSSPIIQQKKQRASSKQPTRPMPNKATRGSVLSVNDNASAIGNYQELNDDQKDDSGHETDASIASQSTIVRDAPSRRRSTLKKGRGGKKAGSRNIEEIVHKSQAPIPSIEVPEGVSLAKMKRVMHLEEVSMTEEVFYTPVPEAPKPAAVEPPPKVIKPKVTKARGRPPKAMPEASSQPVVAVEEPNVVEEAAPVQDKAVLQNTGPIPNVRSPTPAPLDATPSQSPQSSDAENHPPSSKPSAATKKTATPHSVAKRIPLAPTTPSISPSKRNVLAGLQSLHPWTAVDLEAIFLKSPASENSIGNVADFLGGTVDKIRNGDFTSPEKRMTVEEWIHHNAQLAEERLKNECERMVGKFESEGTRAMRALEGVECVE